MYMGDTYLSIYLTGTERLIDTVPECIAFTDPCVSCRYHMYEHIILCRVAPHARGTASHRASYSVAVNRTI